MIKIIWSFMCGVAIIWPFEYAITRIIVFMYVLIYVSYQGDNIQLDERDQICKRSQSHFLLWPWQNTSCQCLAILGRVSKSLNQKYPTRDLITGPCSPVRLWIEIRKSFLFENVFLLPFSDYLKFFSTFKKW